MEDKNTEGANVKKINERLHVIVFITLCNWVGAKRVETAVDCMIHRSVSVATVSLRQ